MEKKKQATAKKNSIKYRDRVPQKVLKKLTPEVRRQYFIWDEILKRQIEKYPMMLFPLVREIFGKEYPDGTDIRFLSTEYIVPKVYGQGQKLLESIRSDLLIQVGSKDLYHMECQMERGGNIAVRMLEYDLNSALVHGLHAVPADGEKRAMKFEVTLPQSAILYLDSTQNQSPSGTESCIIVHPDGTRYEYCVPVLNAQGYTPEMVEEKNLTVLIPFLMIRFRNRFETILKKRDSSDRAKSTKALEEMSTLKKDLTKMAEDCIMIINREEENGRMSSRMGADILELIGKVCDYLFKKEPELLREVHEVMEPAIKLHSEELEEQIAMQQEKLKEKDIQLTQQREQLIQKNEQLAQKDKQLTQMDKQLTQMDKQLTQMDEEMTQHIKNCIHICKKAGNTKIQAEKTLQEIFFLTITDAKTMLEKYW